MSGGEPTIYPDFCVAVFQKMRQAGIHTALETCGYCQEGDLRRIAPYTDLFLYDLKAVSEAAHVQWTGADNVRIKDNLSMLIQSGHRVVVRIPLIPGFNDGVEFVEMMRYLVTLEGVSEVHILPFHQVGAAKYEQAGAVYGMEQVNECLPELAEHQAEVARSYGFAVNIGGWDCR